MSVSQVRYRRRDWFYWLCRILYVLIGLMGIFIALGALCVDMIIVNALASDLSALTPDDTLSKSEVLSAWWIRQGDWYYVKVIGAILACMLFARYAPFVRAKIPIADNEPEDETRYWPLVPLLCITGLFAWFLFYKREDAVAIIDLFLKR